MSEKQQETELPSPPAPISSVGERNLAKINRPRLGEVYWRERLFQLLDQEQNRPVIHVTAPGGAGKTTLVASYLEARKLPCLWYQVQSDDVDVAGFFHYMNQAVRQTAPATVPLPRFSPEFLPNLSVFSHRYFREAYGRFEPPFVIVLEDCHEVGPEALLHDVIRDGLAELPAGFRMILISRDQPPPALARLRLNQSLALLDWEALRLTPDEAEAIVYCQSHGQWVPSPELLERLYARSEGWVAGLVLLAEWARKPDQPRMEDHPQAREIVFDYFAGELFSRTEPVARDFLLQTAILPGMSAAMAMELTGRPEAPAILADLYRRHYFIERRPHADGAAYRYHALFREFLLARAQSVFSPQRLKDLRRRAGALLEQANEPEGAMELLRDAQAWDELVPLLLRQAPILASEGRSKTLAGWLRAVPADVVAEQPWLSYWQGVAAMAFDPPDARRHFGLAFSRFQTLRDPNGQYLAWSGMLESLFGDLDVQVIDSTCWEDFDALRTRHPEFPSLTVEARTTLALLWSLLLFYGQPQRTAYWAMRAERLLALDGIDSDTKNGLAGTVLHQHLWSGDFAKARLVFDRLCRDPAWQATTPTMQVAAWAARAQYFQMTSAYDDCLRAMEEGLEKCHALGIHRSDIAFLCQGAMIAQKFGDLARSRDLLERLAVAVAASGGRGNGSLTYHCQSVGDALCRKDYAVAQEHARTALRIAKETTTYFIKPYLRLSLAYIACGQESHAEATAELAEARRLGVQYLGSPLFDFQSELAESYLVLARDEETSGLEHLRRALAQGRQREFVSWPHCLPPLVLPLFLRALEAGIEVDYVQSVIRRHRMMPDQPPLEIEHWPWEIRIYTLGRFAVVRNGAEMRFQAKAQNKPMELLKALIAQGGRDVHANALIDALWPDAEGDTQKLFEITLHRLRKLLGSGKAITLRAGKASLETHHVWVDVWQMERLITDIELLLRPGASNPAPLLQLSDKLLRTYQGHFLACEEDQAWILATRQRLRGRLERIIAMVAAHRQQAGDLEQAISLYRRGIELDHLAEALYRGLMLCYRDSGRSAEAVEVFLRCKQMLTTHLGVAPGAATLAVYDSIAQH